MVDVCNAAASWGDPFSHSTPRPRKACRSISAANRAKAACIVTSTRAPALPKTMIRETIEDVVGFVRASRVPTPDLSAGRPRPTHTAVTWWNARDLGTRRADYCHLTVGEQPAQKDLGAFVALNMVEIDASRPCYSHRIRRGSGRPARSSHACVKSAGAIRPSRRRPSQSVALPERYHACKRN